MTQKLVLIGLVQPEQDQEEAFRQWYLGNHVEDTFNCPSISSVRCFKAAKGFLGAPPSEYLTIYEFIGEDADAAEEALAAYQADPDGWSQRLPNNNSMAVVGAGWYHEALSFGTQD
ncbi:MAG: hypothetical protein HN856_08725 [Gammaproteobacteria bacterium]|jgi:hypothetical protein|nr:hypothetical protein [Gammaproteobacteria bacterium]